MNNVMIGARQADDPGGFAAPAPVMSRAGRRGRRRLRGRPAGHRTGAQPDRLTDRLTGRRADRGIHAATLYSAGHALSQPIRRLQRPGARPDPAARRRDQRARTRVRGVVRRGDPRADSTPSATRSRKSAAPEEPSEDELHHPDLERRRELAKARRKRENARIQAALDDAAPRGLRADPRGDEADPGHAPLRRPADRRHRPPPGQDRRDAHRRGQDPRRDARRRPQRARRPGRPRRHRRTTTWPGATRSGWARSSTSSGCQPGHDHPRRVVPVRARLSRRPTSA